MKRSFILSLCVFFYLFNFSIGDVQAQSKELRFVTWNMEHLAEHNGTGCIPRYDSDYTKLKDFTESLQADIVSLQEVENVAAVSRVFPESDWTIILSERPSSSAYTCRGNSQKSTQQRVAIAIRKGIVFQDLGSYKELALDRNGLRYGVVIRLIGSKDTIDVMGIHLKSGCFVNDYSLSDRIACEVLEKQVPILDAWIENHIQEKRKFIILGDFNHRLTVKNNKFWSVLNEIDGERIILNNSMQDLKGCHPKYPAPIDHILMGPQASKLQKFKSELVHYFPKSGEQMVENDMLSDHCPISVVLEIN